MSLHTLVCLPVTALLIVLGLLGTPSEAADGKGKFAVRGVGAGSCSQLLSMLNQKEEQARREAVLLNMSWIDGYLSYINRVEKNTFDIMPLPQAKEVLTVVVNQCAANKDTLVETMLLQVVAGFNKAKVQSESPLVKISSGSVEGSLRKETLVAIQNKLIDRKLLKGKADGEYNDSCKKAIMAFQKSVKLEETGYPDVNTIIKLLLS